jgi:RHS repeat-associated protein
MDDERRIALAETKTIDTVSGGTGTTRWRFQLDNHLGSALIELDHAGAVISYEEYHPYGSTAFSAAKAGVEVSAKRYRYTGKERDEETGLYYHGARYYAPWLGRWTAADPLGLADTNVLGTVWTSSVSSSWLPGTVWTGSVSSSWLLGTVWTGTVSSSWLLEMVIDRLFGAAGCSMETSSRVCRGPFSCSGAVKCGGS